MTYSKAELTPVFRSIFDDVVDILRDSFGPRLTRSRGVRYHGDRGNLYLFNIWDSEQSDLLDPDHFCYCFGSYTNRTIEQDGRRNNLSYLHLWINTKRLYYEQGHIVSLLEEAMPRLTPPPFVYSRIDRAIQSKIEFPFIDDFDELKDYLVPLYVTLISAMHPMLLRIIELCKTPLSKEEKRAIIEGRDRAGISVARRPKEELELFSRYCPQAWRPEILEAHGFKCAHCPKLLTVKTAHMDHIIPWSITPMREKANFQPLCAHCNAKKGNRYSY